jgi:hypothetical protein
MELTKIIFLGDGKKLLECNTGATGIQYRMLPDTVPGLPDTVPGLPDNSAGATGCSTGATGGTG